MDMLSRIVIQKPEVYVALDEVGFETYYRAERIKGFLSGVTKTVESSLKSLPPEDSLGSFPFKYGDIEGRINISQAVSVSYAKLVERIQLFLENYLENGNTEISTKTLLDEYNKQKSNVTSDNLRKKIAFEDIASLIESAGLTDGAPDKSIFFADISKYKSITPQALFEYLTAKELSEYVTKEIVKPFDTLLTKEALDILGVVKEDLKETVRTVIHFDMRAFDVQVIAQPRPPYKKVLDFLFSPDVSKKTGLPGEIVVLSSLDLEILDQFKPQRDRNCLDYYMRSESLPLTIDECDISIEDLARFYNPEKCDEGVLIPTELVKQRLDAIMDENTKTYARTEWHYDPILEFASVL